MSKSVFDRLPSVGELLDTAPLRRLVDKMNHNRVTSRVRGVLEEMRGELQTARSDLKFPSVSELAERIARRIFEAERPPLRSIVNATGVILPSGLGRAPLSEEALAEAVAVGRGYASVEPSRSGQPAGRQAAVEGLLVELSGAEAALVVNNQAAALLLTMAALAGQREVVVARGQLLEIGGDYRLPDVIAASGARLREIGATNRTTLEDYRSACGDQTAALLLVEACGTPAGADRVVLTELVRLAQERSIPLVHVLGPWGLIEIDGLPADAPNAAKSITEGADVVLASGDKLVGGPQAGLTLGRRRWLERIAKHPLGRALRADKLTLAALAGTLRSLRNPATARRTLPVWQLLATPIENLQQRATRLAEQMAESPAVAKAEARQTQVELGDEALAGQGLTSWAVALEPQGMSLEQLSAALLAGEPGIVGRIADGRLWLELRSVMPREDHMLLDAVLRLRSTTSQTQAS